MHIATLKQVYVSLYEYYDINYVAQVIRDINKIPGIGSSIICWPGGHRGRLEIIRPALLACVDGGIDVPGVGGCNRLVGVLLCLSLLVFYSCPPLAEWILLCLISWYSMPTSAVRWR